MQTKLGSFRTKKYDFTNLIIFHQSFQYITDPGVESCGSLNLSLEPLEKMGKKNREIQAKMLFGDTEIKATAIDIATKQSVKVYVDFLNENNPKYITKL